MTDSSDPITVAAALDRFLDDLKVGQSRKTVQTYATVLRRFQESLGSNTIPVHDLSVDRAIQFVHWLRDERFKDQELSKATLRTYLAAVSSLFSFLIREKLISVPADELERLRAAYANFRKGGHRRLPKTAAEEEVSALIGAARTVPAKTGDPRYELARLRNIAVLETLRSTGMRVGELVSLRRRDLDSRDRTARIVGKGDRERVVYFDRKAWQALQTYLRARQDGASGRALYDLPVFARHDRGAGKRVQALTTHSVRRIINELLQAAGIEYPITPHILRHTFATRALEVTGDLAVVQDLLGHAEPTTTRIYAKVRSKRLHEAHRQIFEYDSDAADES